MCVRGYDARATGPVPHARAARMSSAALSSARRGGVALGLSLRWKREKTAGARRPCAHREEGDDDDVYYYMRWRLKLEGETENTGVCTKERKGVTAEVLMATPCTNSLLSKSSLSHREVKVGGIAGHLRRGRGKGLVCAGTRLAGTLSLENT